jgi:hypothetical protein
VRRSTLASQQAQQQQREQHEATCCAPDEPSANAAGRIREAHRRTGERSPPFKSSKNSKANRIETGEGPVESGEICSMEVVKNSEENSENKRCYSNTSYDPAQGCR